MTREITGRPPAANGSRASRIGLGALRVLVLLLVVAVSAAIFTFRGEAARWAVFGYPGIFLISILANATVLLPAPGIAVVFAMGGVLDPFLVALAAGVGAALGEMSGYGAGYGSQRMIERIAVYDRIVPWMRKYGGLTTLALAAVPNPFFDLAGIAAGATGMPFRRFMLWCLAGKLIKMLIVSYTGAYSVEWLANFLG